MTGTNLIVISARELMDVIETLDDAREQLPAGGRYSELRIISATKSLMRLAINDLAVEAKKQSCSP